MRQRVWISACPETSHRGLQSGTPQADAWLDLWCWPQSLAGAQRNVFFLFSALNVQFGQYGAVLTLKSLWQALGMEKTKVRRFSEKHADAFLP